MKSLLTGLLIISSVQIANAASTDTIKVAKEKIVELRITNKEVMRSMPAKRKGIRIEKLPSESLCSGAFVTSTGDILTAKHCTENAESIEVLTSDGKQYTAVIVATSKIHDLSLIHIDKFDTPHFTLARSLEQGQRIYVLGSPVGVTGSLSTGVVAKLNGDINFIDCGALPGNSGGPAFNDAGEMVGVVTAGLIVLYGTTHLNVMQSLEALIGFATSHGK